jgi:hypothetical protein
MGKIENKLDILIAKIMCLISMYEQNLKENEPVEKKPVGRPKKFDTPEERKKTHSDRLKAEKYSTMYYNKMKCRVECEFCGKDINNLAKTSHYKSKKCTNSRMEARILTSRIE